ncbi:MAG: hypothetical protein JF571_13375 [Asticcacaulis sp.]|nr:hypothetical protein [Asticcacaulis sp.]
MRFLAAGAATLTLPLCIAGGACAQAAKDPDCVYMLGSVPRGAPTYSQFPAKPVAMRKPAAAIIAGRDARTFRTRIREGAKRGPNFAGHYTLIHIGCGADCQMSVVVDALTGKVYFDPTIATIWAGRVDSEADARPAPGEFDVFSSHWRNDSSLLIALGAPNEDLSRDGVGYYNWTGTRFVLVRQYAAKDICHPRPDGH